ncbi:MAG TPA: type II secretion system protein [Solirubrobacterales bacterium]|jgi:prepilin-type N-terminal cleavage/methylation domain-containing protein|nr:type II secretion system protein [Solirubrobacterales bacterium]
MLLQNIRARIGARLSGDSEAGFTLIELLVVMLIIGILAAIALPSFFNQKTKAGDAKAKETAHSVQVAMETCSTDNPSGNYEGCAEPGVLEGIESSLTGQTFTVTVDPTNQGYTISVPGANGNVFEITRETDGELVFPCSEGGKGGCPAGAEGWKNG